MSHWAKVNDDNIVIEVLACVDDDYEAFDFLTTQIGGRWIKTSYNTINNKHILGGTPLRGNFAGQGFIYLEDLDIFVEPKPFPSWILNKETASWDPPVSKPTFGRYIWSEEQQNWIRYSVIPEQYRTEGHIL